MSEPRTASEREQAEQTLAMAGQSENLVSTACPACGTRFAMLAKFYADAQLLRCTVCGWHGHGQLKASG